MRLARYPDPGSKNGWYLTESPTNCLSNAKIRSKIGQAVPELLLKNVTVFRRPPNLQMHKLFCFSTDFLQWPLKICVMQNCVSLRSPIFDFGSGGPSKFEKHPIFDVFEGFSPITLVFLNRFTSKRVQNACINELHVNSRPIIFWGCQGAVKIEKHPIFHVFGHKNA